MIELPWGEVPVREVVSLLQREADGGRGIAAMISSDSFVSDLRDDLEARANWFESLAVELMQAMVKQQEREDDLGGLHSSGPGGEQLDA